MKSDSIVIRNARVNNLKNVSLSIPRGKLVVVTGVSGSGKGKYQESAFDRSHYHRNLRLSSIGIRPDWPYI